MESLDNVDSDVDRIVYTMLNQEARSLSYVGPDAKHDSICQIIHTTLECYSGLGQNSKSIKYKEFHTTLKSIKRSPRETLSREEESLQSQSPRMSRRGISSSSLLLPKSKKKRNMAVYMWTQRHKVPHNQAARELESTLAHRPSSKELAEIKTELMDDMATANQAQKTLLPEKWLTERCEYYGAIADKWKESADPDHKDPHIREAAPILEDLSLALSILVGNLKGKVSGTRGGSAFNAAQARVEKHRLKTAQTESHLKEEQLSLSRLNGICSRLQTMMENK